MTSKQQLRTKIEKFLAQSGMSPTRFGVEALGDRAFMNRLRAGSEIRTDTIDKIDRFIDGWRPNHSRPLVRRRADSRRMTA
jgi:hypothetical protein